MMRISVSPHAFQDILLIRGKHPKVAATVLVVLETIGADPQFIDKLLTRGENTFSGTRINVKRWERMWKQGLNLWRLRILDTPATVCRVFYGYIPLTREISVLAVVERERFDYDDTNSDIAKRILVDWEKFTS